jgi:hypothetical protein
VLLVLVGVIVLMLGVVIWARDDPVNGVDGAVDRLIGNAMDQTMPAAVDVVAATVTVLLVLIVLSAALMLLGLTGAGRLVRAAAVFSVLCGAGVMSAAPIARLAGFDTGVVLEPAAFALIAAGAAIAFIGGVLLRR